MTAGRKSWLRRFAFGLVIMIALNAARLGMTWRTFGTDGMEQVGFPFVFFERGGFAYHENWYLEVLAINIGIAFAAAYGIAQVLRDGWRAAFRNLRAWGLDYVSKEENVDDEMRTSEFGTEPSGERDPPMTRIVES